jgi:septal ring factor EnvC (AmiA/AmiB activator)
MQLTTSRLKQIIKEELEAITSEMVETEEEVSEIDAEIASLEQQLAEAKKSKGKMAAMKGKGEKMAATRHVGKRPPAAKPMKGGQEKQEFKPMKKG